MIEIGLRNGTAANKEVINARNFRFIQQSDQFFAIGSFIGINKHGNLFAVLGDFIKDIVRCVQPVMRLT